MSATCDADSDHRFGPRVATNCRRFDFTLLFEDAVLTMIPAALFVFFLLPRLHSLRRGSVKVMSYKLAAYKMVGVTYLVWVQVLTKDYVREKTLLTALFILQVIYAALRTRTSVLRTPLSLPSDILNVVVTAGAVVLSFLEDQRSIRPSDLLVVYFSLLVLLWVPRLRSLWLISASGPCRDLWTTIYAIVILIVFLESTRKTKALRPLYKHVTVEQASGFWCRSLFIWVVPFIKTGWSTILSVGDVPEVDESLQGDVTHVKLERAWTQSKGKHRLIKAVFRAYLWPTLSGIIPRLILSGFTFCQPFLITSTVDYFTRDAKSKPKEYGQALIGAFLLVYLGIAISTAVYWRQTFRLGTMVRAGLMLSLYRQTTLLAGEDVKGSAALTLMGTDVERIVNSFWSLHQIWASIIEVAIAIYLLQRQVYLACLVPAIISLACVFGAGPISARTGPAQKAWAERVEKRIAVTSSMLRDMKSVKILGLTDVFLGLITKLRVAELNTSSRFRKLYIWMVLLSNIPMDLAPYATFAIYAIISVVRNNQSLAASRAFTSLSLISLMTTPLLEFVQAVPSFTQCFGCFERIEAYLEKAPITNSSSNGQRFGSTDTEPEQADYADKPSILPGVVSIKDADISWPSDSETVFQNLNLEIGKGITMITGPVGSGKSALIKSLLGEMTVSKGSVNTTFSNTAYCPQIPWIVDDTIRHNITGGTDFDPKWYEFAVSSCGLNDDFRSIPAGDMHVAGSSGASLSGGQKQRVALARAIYSRLPVILLDDIFNGLDSKRISDISTKLFAEHGYFRTAAKTVILVTHTESLLPFSDDVIVLDHGAVAYRGSYEDLMDRKPGAVLKNFILPQEEKIGPGPEMAPTEESRCDTVGKDLSDGSQKKGELDFSRRNGTWKVYTYYARSAGPWITAVFVASFIVWSFLSTFTTLWIQWWSDSNAKDPNGKIGWYLGFYTAFTVVSILSFFIGCVLLFIHIINDTVVRGLHNTITGERSDLVVRMKSAYTPHLVKQE